MDSKLSHVIFIHKDVQHERLVPARFRDTSSESEDAAPESRHITESLHSLLEYTDVEICSSGASCISTVIQLLDSSLEKLTPFIVLIDTPYDEEIPQPQKNRSSSPEKSNRELELHTPDDEVYGLKLLQRIMTEAHLRSMSKLVVAIPVISYPIGPMSPSTSALHEFPTQPINTSEWVDRRLLQRCLDLGATDIIVGPINQKSVTSLEVHAYRAYRDALRDQQAILEVRRGRRRSWVGVNEEKPYSYLREAMVSGLMKGICRYGGEDDLMAQTKIAVPLSRQSAIADAIGKWHFSAHSFSDDELLFASMLIFKHALTMPELEKWKIPTDQLINFLVACRAAYNNFVPYHNFRHVVDVLQATFSFLVNLGALPPYPATCGNDKELPSKSPMAELIEPFEALTLLITAIGHDVGHPGVNNGFLVTLNSPLAQLYNDRSVLESFHCAAYSQILRRYWYSAFEDTKMRSLMISSILATDMGLHFDYMKKLADATVKLKENNNISAWDAKTLLEQKSLACSLIIKCADICNVAREYSTAVEWMHVLSDEFARQWTMENELQIKSSLMSPPKQDMESLCKSQTSFMNLFAIPLFQGVAAVMPNMQYTVDQLTLNRSVFENFGREISAQASPVCKSRPSEITVQDNSNDSDELVQSDDTVDTSILATESQTCKLLDYGRQEQNARASVFSLGSIPVSPYTLPPPLARSASRSSSRVEAEGIVTSFESVADFAASDPFNLHHLDDSIDVGLVNPGKQRRSETTTEGSASGPSTNDWESQTNSATGKLPLSPSTRGTSINSQSSSHDEGLDVPVRIVFPDDSSAATPTNIDSYSRSPDDSSASNTSSIGRAEGETLKKRPSRFRMNAFTFFKRKGTSPSPVSHVSRHISG
ncbi:hypothetical protein BROUX41_004119 [Berkeleyomyces rouxiae]|uniref:uncharacterized protein n=1 Tax=Berkeleyomyces rouxiae TaxID=2035830 RepID=UPI003B7C78CF